MNPETELVRARLRMVETQIMSRGVRDERVLDALRSVRRHEFVPPEQAAHAYEDRPLPIGHNQTISQPYIVAWMTELLRLEPSHEVLEIGAGCGYQTAVLSRLCKQVWGLERIEALAETARRNLARAAVENATIAVGDGNKGLAEHQPYARILVAAAAPAVPRALLEQLAPGGRLVIPLGSREGQEMTVVVRDLAGNYEREYLGSVSFVPLIS